VNNIPAYILCALLGAALLFAGLRVEKAIRKRKDAARFGLKGSGDDFLKKMVIGSFGFIVVYMAWCWAAKIIWQLDPPEGISLGAIATSVTELLGCSMIQVSKQLKKPAKNKKEKTP